MYTFALHQATVEYACTVWDPLNQTKINP